MTDTTDARATDDFRPASLAEYIGQAPAKRLISVEIAAAMAETRPFPHLLLAGPSGSGKSTIANVIAAELGDPLLVLTHVPSREELVEKLTDLGPGIVLLDEIHQWTGRQQVILLTLLWDGTISDPDFGLMEFPWLTVIGATTERHLLSKPLRSRFGLAPMFVDYTDEEMAAIVAQMAEHLGVELDEETTAVLGRAAGGMPRQAHHLVSRARSLAHAGDLVVADILALAGVDADGLTHEHLAYLSALIDLGGRAGLNRIAERLRVSEKESLDLEYVLTTRKLVTFGARGRVITPAGRQRITPVATGGRHRSEVA